MSDKNKVVWSEGLFLRTQHFQQQDRYTDALVRGALGALSLQHWGFRQLELDAPALGAGRISISAGAGILPDGTPFTIPDAVDAPQPLAVTSSMSGIVSLGLPLEIAGAAVVDPAHMPATGARYRGMITNVRDSVRGGANPEEIEVARPAARLLAPGDDMGGYSTLPIARIDGLKADGSVGLVEGFLPPAVVSGAVAFYRQFLQEVVTGLDRIADAHGEIMVSGAGRGIENLLILELANTARPAFAHMLSQDLYHPSELFRALASLAGKMATHGSGSRRLQELPAYSHMDPQPAFTAIVDTLRSLMLSLRHVEQKSRALVVAKHSTNVWKVRIDNPEMLTSSRIVLRIGSELSEDALRKIFVQQATVGSADQFEALWKSRLPGIALKPLHSQPREIPYDGDRLCLELDQKSAHWASLLDAPGFIIGVSGTLPSEPTVDCYAVSR